MNFIIYNVQTGEIRSQYACADKDAATVENQLSEGQNYLHTDPLLDADSYYVKTVNGQPTVLSRGKRPSNFYSWVNEQWVLDEPRYTAFMADEVRVQRLQLLMDSDWTDTLSAKTRLGDDLYSQWQIYRQALRDITQQPGFPLDVIWPTPPT